MVCTPARSAFMDQPILNAEPAPRSRLKLRLLAVAAVAYVLLPLDAIPDVVPIVGWMDDAGVLSAVALFAAQELRKRRRVQA